MTWEIPPASAIRFLLSSAASPSALAHGPGLHAWHRRRTPDSQVPQAPASILLHARVFAVTLHSLDHRLHTSGCGDDASIGVWAHSHVQLGMHSAHRHFAQRTFHRQVVQQASGFLMHRLGRLVRGHGVQNDRDHASSRDCSTVHSCRRRCGRVNHAPGTVEDAGAMLPRTTLGGEVPQRPARVSLHEGVASVLLHGLHQQLHAVVLPDHALVRRCAVTHQAYARTTRHKPQQDEDARGWAVKQGTHGSRLG